MFKLHKNYFLQALLFIVAVVGMNSCSCNSKDTIEDKVKYLVPDDVDLVFTGDVSRTLSALEVSVEDGTLVLPEYLTDLISTTAGRSDAREFEESLDMVKGIDYTNAVAAMRISEDGPDMVFAFNVTDEDELYNSITDFEEDFDIEESGDYKVITNEEKAAFVIKDGLATMVLKRGRPLEVDDAVEMLEKWISKAEESPLADWKKTYLTQPAVLNVWYNIGMIQELDPRAFHEIQSNLDEQGSDIKLSEMSIGARFDLAGPSVKANLTAFDGTGSEYKNPYAGKFDSALLDYAAPTDYVAASIAVNDKCINAIVGLFNKAIDQEINSIRQNGYYDQAWADEAANQMNAMRDEILGLVKAFDGNAMVAFGTAPGVTLSGISFADPASYHMVAAVKCKPGKTNEVFSKLCETMDNICAANDTVAQMPSEVAKVYGDSYHNSINVLNGYDDYYEPVYTNINLYAKIDGDAIIVSNAPISRQGGSNFDRNVFASNAMAVQLNVPNDSPLLDAFDLPCGLEATLTANSALDIDITFSGTNQNFVPALVKIINGLN